MIGVVLAAGTGRRLRPYTDGLPKALVPIGEDLTPLDVILANFVQVGVTDVAVVVGYAADAVHTRKRSLERRHGVTLRLIHNERAETWNNCYSLWCARHHLLEADVLLANGDTVHPLSVELELVKGAEDTAPIALATDTVKQLGHEEMKVVSPDGRTVSRLSKQVDPATAHGEYIGVATVRADVGPLLVEALEATWRRDPSLYYEDGFQALIDRDSVRIGITPIGDVPWVEIDDTDDLARATEVAVALTKD